MNPHTELIKSCLILAQIPKVGSQRIIKLLERYKSVENIIQADEGDLSNVPSISQKLAHDIKQHLRNPKKRAEIDNKVNAQFEQADKLNTQIVTFWDDNYPALLKQIYDPPAFIFVRGNSACFNDRTLAIVGTRHNSEYGKHVTQKLCEGLAESGFTVVSGLAFGIDSIAHKAMLLCNAPTIAVLAGGVDYIYTDPKGQLYPKIIEHGAIVSEEFIGTKATADKFPKRNRIISGLSLGTLVVESDINGGALITASYALDQNREVFAVPGNIFSKKSRGTNELIREGKAKLVLTVEDILNELSTNLKSSQTNKDDKNLPLFNQLESLSESEQQIFKLFNNEPSHIDDLAIQSGLDISDILAELFELEMKGIIEQLPGKYFQRILR